MNVVKFLLSLFASNTVFHIVTVSAGWIAYERSEDPMSIAMIGLMQFLPVVCLFPISGYVCDRFDKRKTIAVASLASVCASLLLFFWTLSDDQSLFFFYVLIFFYSVARSFEAPASASYLPELVTLPKFSKSVARSSSIKQITKVLGPVVAGYLLASNGFTGAVFLMSAIFALISALAISLTKPLVTSARKPRFESGRIFQGLLEIKTNPVLLGALSLDLLAGLFGGLMALLPMLVKDVLQDDASTLGWLRASVALGSLATSIILSIVTVNKDLGKWLIHSVFGLGLCITAAAFAEGFYVLAVLLFVFGVLDAFSVHIRQNLIQLASSVRVRGRVTAAGQMFIVISNQLSDVRAGFMVATLGLIPTVFIGGVAVTTFAMTWKYLFPQMAGLDKFEDAAVGNYRITPAAT